MADARKKGRLEAGPLSSGREWMGLIDPSGIRDTWLGYGLTPRTHQRIAELLRDPGSVVARIQEPLERQARREQRRLAPRPPAQRRPPNDVVAIGGAPHDVVA